jgi:hypothetical protein
MKNLILCTVYMMLTMIPMSLFLFVGFGIDNEFVSNDESIFGRAVYSALPAQLVYGIAAIFTLNSLQAHAFIDVTDRRQSNNADNALEVPPLPSQAEEERGAVPQDSHPGLLSSTPTTVVRIVQRPDGTQTTTTTRTTIQTDGSKVVTETIEEEMYAIEEEM